MTVDNPVEKNIVAESINNPLVRTALLRKEHPEKTDGPSVKNNLFNKHISTKSKLGDTRAFV